MNETIKKEIFAILGIAGPSGGIAISLSEVETWLRITSLLIGIIIGCFSARSLYLSNKKKALRIEELRAKLVAIENEPETDL